MPLIAACSLASFCRSALRSCSALATAIKIRAASRPESVPRSMFPSTSANRTPALSNRGIRYSRSSGSRMNRSHLKHSTASTARASTSRIASSYPGRYFPGLVGSLRVTPMSLSDSR